MKIAAVNKQQLLERFVQYVSIGTAANPATEEYPSSPGQLKLGRVLVDQLLELGIADAHQDAHGLVWGTVPGRAGLF